MSFPALSWSIEALVSEYSRMAPRKEDQGIPYISPPWCMVGSTIETSWISLIVQAIRHG